MNFSVTLGSGSWAGGIIKQQSNHFIRLGKYFHANNASRPSRFTADGDKLIKRHRTQRR